jgi:cytochrome oxidase Cu insertion factor (SCO1/SenC/PrrC family)
MNHRVKLLAICAVFIIPLVAAAIAFFLLPPAKSMNYGELVKPVIALPEVPVSLAFPGDNGDGKQVNIDRGLRGKWLMVMQDTSACAERCQKKLYAMRQARTILGREQDRTMRVVLLTDDGQPSAELQAAYKGTVWLKAKDHAWVAALAKLNADHLQKSTDEIYGVDTLGNLFIRYQYDADIKRIVGDFNRVMKTSQIG